MADENKPRISITRGKRKNPKSASASTSSTKSSSGTWFLPSGLGALSEQVADGVRDVWLAGLGTLSVAEEQGTKLFRSLVKEGEAWERERREQAARAFKQVEERIETSVEEGRDEAVSINQKVTHQVRESVDAALERLGVPSQQALDDLRRQVDELSAQADRLARSLEKQQTKRDE